jgi:putative endonuclease
MHYVYLLKSKKTSQYYIGCTGDLKKRVGQHNANESSYTKNKGPWEVRYYEAFYSKNDAFQREKQLKKNKSGLRELKKRLGESIK